MSYGLPKSVEINGKEFAIRYDYRVILDIFEAMNDPDSSEEDKIIFVFCRKFVTLINNQNTRSFYPRCLFFDEKSGIIVEKL